MSHQLWLWVLFNLFVLAMLALDLGVFHRKAHEVKFKEALGWTVAWVALALLFNAALLLSPHWFGIAPELARQRALEFLTGYTIEKALSIDNIFVFLMIFGYFRVPALYQHKVLFWGILWALVCRAIFIIAGVKLLAMFHWMIYVFGAILILTGIKMWWAHGKELHPERNPVLRLFRKVMPVTPDYEGDRFFVRRAGRTWATPLFVALLLIETTDVIFAVDSIPAILAITNDPFIVYTSNVFAILGLRSLFFALAGFMSMFRFISHGLAVILVFIGGKMLLIDVVGKVPVGISLGVIVAILAVSVLASMLLPAPGKSAEKRPISVG